MCGIAGFIGRFGRPVLKKMAAAITHRGPDDEGYEVIDLACFVKVGFAHRRLSIIDLSGGHQPMWTGDHRAVIIFNGEVYNYRELRRELQKLGATFQTESDTEVILEGWRYFGEKVVEKLEGMFAFAIWDSEHQVMFLARDRFGIKPLYWTQPKPKTFGFASEIKPLLLLSDGVTLHRPAFFNYLLYGWNSDRATMFEGINQLPPAHHMIVRPGEAPCIERYWDLPSPQAKAPDPEAIAAALDKAVKSQLVADVPVGVALSGGLDSSAVLASMSRAMPAQDITAFTVGYGLPDDEIPFARMVASHVGADLKERIFDANCFSREFARFVWHLEEPLAHPVMMTTFLLSSFVSEKLKVILIGEGSDELFAGYPQYRLFMPPLSAIPMTRGMTKQAFLAIANLMPPPRHLRKMLRPEMLDEVALQTADHRYDHYFHSADRANGALQLEIKHELVHNQLARVDKLTMAHSIEARVPFLDSEFAALAMSSPFSAKVKGGIQKALLRDAFAGQLPDKVIRRPKTGNQGTQALLPTLMATIRSGPLAELISHKSIERRGWFDPTAVHSYLGAADNGLLAYHPVESRRRAKFALALAVLEQWARLFLDGEQHDFTR